MSTSSLFFGSLRLLLLLCLQHVFLGNAFFCPSYSRSSHRKPANLDNRHFIHTPSPFHESSNLSSLIRTSRHSLLAAATSELGQGREELWEKNYQLLVQFKQREGHPNAPQKHKEDGQNLGMWLTTQRQRERTGTLAVDRRKKLEELGVSLTPRRRSWEEMYDLLIQFKKREGHPNIPATRKEDGQNLGMWLHSQRQLQRKGTLAVDRQKKLDALGVSFDPLRSSWEEMYDLLVQYKEKEGHPNVPQRRGEDVQLANWLREQRQRQMNGTLAIDRQRMLEELGVWWASPNKPWEEMYDLLVQYKEREGSANVPRAHKEDGENLGMWLFNQRGFQRTGRLAIDRERKLDKLGSSWSRSSKQRWEDMYDLLVEYNEREGHTNVPFRHKEDGQNLGTWLNSQRQSRKKGTLASDRQKKLEKLGIS